MVGDVPDLTTRLKRLLPSSWFADSAPVLTGLLQGPATVLAWLYGLYAYALLQTRLATATGGWLDMAAADYFDDVRRFANESDQAFSRRISLEVLRGRLTRSAIDRSVYDITGVHPRVFEGWRPADCGGYGTPGLAFGKTGRYASKTLFEVFVTLPQPQNYGIPNRGGWGSLTGGYGAQGSFSFVDPADIVGSGPTLTDIVKSVERVRAAGVKIYLHFTQLGVPDSFR